MFTSYFIRKYRINFNLNKQLCQYKIKYKIEKKNLL